jgi:monoamine oxidase
MMVADPNDREGRRPRTGRVVVVGGGLSGLVAARTLVRAGREVTVLEARARVGGRVCNVEVDGVVLEAGAQFIGPRQPHVAALAADLGVDTYRVFDEGDPVLDVGGRHQRFHGVLPPIGPAAMAELVALRTRLVRAAGGLPAREPWATAAGRRADRIPFARWADRHVRTRVARGLVRAGCRMVLSTEPEAVSTLHVLSLVRAAGGVVPLLAGEGGAHEQRFVGGSGRLTARLAAELGDRIRLEQPVRRIRQDAHGVVVETAGEVHAAEHVVVALPPPLVAELEVMPPLPAPRRELVHRVPMGQAIKVQATYDEPFWRRDGRSGQLVSDVGPASAVFDNTPPGERPGVLMGFVTGAPAVRFRALAPERRRAAALGGFVRAVGPRARAVRAYIEHDWIGERWTRGGYFGVPHPGALSELGDALRRPVGRLHWAGTETASGWTGYLDGAVEAGDRAAREVLAY